MSVTPDARYMELGNEARDIRRTRGENAFKCYGIWMAFAILYFAKELLGNTDPRAVAFHRAIPWFSIVVAVWFLRLDRYLFTHFKKVVNAGISYETSNDPAVFALHDTEASVLGFTTVQLMLLGGMMVWVYVLGNHYFNFHSLLLERLGLVSAILSR